mgnify:CR=1 FL=1
MSQREKLSDPDPNRQAVRAFADDSEPIAETLGEIREGIDEIDQEIIRLLGERSLLVRDAARFKKALNEVPALKRQHAQFENLRKLAEAQESPLEGFPELVEELYRSLIPGFVELQKTAFEDTVLIDNPDEVD